MEGDEPWMINEKRKYERALFDCEILYPTLMNEDRKETLMDSSYNLLAVDISESGICLQSNFPIVQDSFISFYLRIEDNLPFKTLVKIRWHSIKDGKYTCGGEFIALNLQDIHILRNYVSKHLS
jgi:hypothetical protein